MSYCYGCYAQLTDYLNRVVFRDVTVQKTVATLPACVAGTFANDAEGSKHPSPGDSLCREIRACLNLRAHLRVRALQRRNQLIQRVDVGLGGSNDNIGVGAMAVNNAHAFFQTHRYLAL